MKSGNYYLFFKEKSFYSFKEKSNNLKCFKIKEQKKEQKAVEIKKANKYFHIMADHKQKADIKIEYYLYKYINNDN